MAPPGRRKGTGTPAPRAARGPWGTDGLPSPGMPRNLPLPGGSRTPRWPLGRVLPGPLGPPWSLDGGAWPVWLWRQLLHCGPPQVPPQRLGVDIGRSVGSGVVRGRLENHTPPAVGGPGYPPHGALSPGRVCNTPPPPAAEYLYSVATRHLVYGHVGRPLL